MKTIAVAIDGPSGAGKSTIACAAAQHLGFMYVDTGAMYRTIGLAACRAGIQLEDNDAVIPLLSEISVDLRYENGEQRVLLNGEDVSDQIRTQEMSSYASFVSAIPQVRAFLLDTQRNMAKKYNVIMDGRDIGTVVVPDAPVKIFLTASAEARAHRRYLQLIQKGQKTTEEQVLAEQIQRDHNDSTRAAAPLKQAEDAVLVDTSALTLEQSIETVEEIIRRGMGDNA